MESVLPPIARALKAWREQQGLSQADAAKTLGLPLRSWRNMEQMGTAPTTNVANVAGTIILGMLGVDQAR